MEHDIIIRYVTSLGEPGSLVLSDRSQSEINAVIRNLITYWGAQKAEVI